MKKINQLLIGAILAIFFISCDMENEGALFSAPQADKASFLAKSGNWDLSNAAFNVPVGRTSTQGELAVSVEVTAAPENVGYTDVFRITSPANFAAGEDMTEITLGFSDLSTINPASLSIIPDGMDVNVGLSYPIVLAIAPASVAYANIAKFDVITSNNLEFEGAGKATFDSSGGWMEETLTPEIKKAKGVNVYKIVQPFGFSSFAFMIMSDGVTVACPDQIIYNHPGYGPVTMGKVVGTYDAATKKVTLDVGGYTVSAGSFGGGIEVIYLP